MRSRLRRLVSAAFVLGLAAAIFPTPAVAASRLALAPGDPAPPMRGETPTGEQDAIRYSTNKLTLVNFWATWCEPCLEEMPALQRLYDAHSAEGLEVVGALVDQVSAQEAGAFLEAVGETYPIIKVGRRIRKAWMGVGTLPVSFLIDDQGVILRRYVGATKEQIAGLRHDVEAKLNGRPLGPFVTPETPYAVTDEDRIRARTDSERGP